MSIESVMPFNHLILWFHLLLTPSIFSSIRVFSNELALSIRWPKYWSFSFNISPSNDYPELISFRMDWLYLLAVQGTLKSLLQPHSSKVSILWHLAVFHLIANRWGNSGWIYFGGSKITADGDCSHEIKRRLFLGRKVMTKPRQHIKKQRHYFVNKGPSIQGYGFF